MQLYFLNGWLACICSFMVFSFVLSTKMSQNKAVFTLQLICASPWSKTHVREERNVLLGEFRNFSFHMRRSMFYLYNFSETTIENKDSIASLFSLLFRCYSATFIKKFVLTTNLRIAFFLLSKDKCSLISCLPIEN